jgi:sulfur-carrier protein
MARVRLRAPLRRLAGDHREHRVDGATVRDVLGELERREPGVAGWVLDERGRVRRHIKVFVNGTDSREDVPVDTDDLVDVLPAISGG